MKEIERFLETIKKGKKIEKNNKKYKVDIIIKMIGYV